MSKTIVLQGGYGGHDSGDEAQLTTPLIYLKRFIPDAKFLALSHDPQYTSEFHQIESDYGIPHYLLSFPSERRNIYIKFYMSINALIRTFKLLLGAFLISKGKKDILLNKEGQRLLSNLKNADLLFNVGGGNLNSSHRVDLFCKGLTFWVCQILGKPVIVSGQTIGPFDNWLHKKFAKFVLNKVNIITLRDTKSSSLLLKDIGVTKPVIRETADDGTLLPPTEREKAYSILESEKINIRYPLIGINMCGSLETLLHSEDKQKVNASYKIIAQVADHLISDLKATIVFIPMDYNPVTDDRIAASRVLELMKYRDRAHVIYGEYDDRTLKGIIGQLDLAIGFRYHFIVFATTMGVPSLGVYLGDYYKLKMDGILGMMEQGEYALNMEMATPEQIIEMIKQIIINKDDITKTLNEKTRILSERSLYSVNYAAKLLKNKD